MTWCPLPPPGISGDRVEIDPVQVRSSLNVSKFLSKPRAVTYQMDSVMECRLLDVKYGGERQTGVRRSGERFQAVTADCSV